MAELITVKSKEEYKAVIIGVKQRKSIDYSMDELEGLAIARGVTVLEKTVQTVNKINQSTYLGKGKIEELKLMVEALDCNLVIANDELSGIQTRNLEDALKVQVIDRTILILDIFAERATTLEGKLQVELAQLEHRLTRLTGKGIAMSNPGAGIGTRGPGEKKLEVDRRHITKRIYDIKKELKEADKTRRTKRKKAEKAGLPLVSLVGYTNSGKSAIMNRILMMTGKEDKIVFEEDLLFATLDTSKRLIKAKDNRDFLLTDTVGFVSKLPHPLVKAFRATLEEASQSDLILVVVDGASSYQDFHLEVTEEVLRELSLSHKERLTVFNKEDLFKEDLEVKGKDNIAVSARTGFNFDKLLGEITERLYRDELIADLLIPFERGDILSYLMKHNRVMYIKHTEKGTELKVAVKEEEYKKLKEFYR
ncbi:MAG: GTPase HflX [Anaerovoracaceae bacterium]|nr:GTPase HflX [Clostridiales bacterium]